MNWTDFWAALETNGAVPSAGLALIVVGATFRWIEAIYRFLGRIGQNSDPFAASRNWIAARRAEGDEAAARRAEERIRDQRARMTRYGRAMMVAGAVILALSVLFL